MTGMVGASLSTSYTAADLTGVEAGTTPAVGDKYADHQGNCYMFYQYDTGAGAIAAVIGNVAFFYAPGGTSAGATTVATSDLSDSAGVGAGVLMSAPGDGEYGWVQVTGPATLTTGLAGGADGNALTPVGGADGTLDVSALVTDSICAVAIDQSADIIMCCFPH